MAAVLVAARLCEPSSELHIAEDWYRRTALRIHLSLVLEQQIEGAIEPVVDDQDGIGLQRVAQGQVSDTA